LIGKLRPRCDEIEAQGDWVKNAILTHYQEDKLKALGGDTYGLSLAEGIAYRIGNYLLFHAMEFVISGQLAFDGSASNRHHSIPELVWDGKQPREVA
jgi:hypothetical protein